MSRTFRIKIITPDETVFDADIVSLVAPGAQGSLGVLADHAALVTPLASGVVEVISADRLKRQFGLEKGFLEVRDNEVNILAEKVRL